MATIINLRRTRKQRDRDAKRVTGNENAAKFGEATSIRTLRHAEAERAARNLDAHRRDDGETDD